MSSSCSKKKNENCLSSAPSSVADAAKENTSNTSKLPYELAANPANPFDSIGYWHNKVLQMAAPCLAEADGADHHRTIACVTPYLYELFGALPHPNAATVYATVIDAGNQFQNTFHALPYSHITKVFLDSVISFVSDTATGRDIGNYLQFRNRIISLEDYVHGSGIFTPAEKRVLFCASSVARYSAAYWTGAGISTQAKLFKNIVRWIAATTSDIGGAVVGAAGSSDVGTVVAYATSCSAYARNLVTYSMPEP